MKDLEYYLRLPYHLELVPDPDEGGYLAYYPELPGCLTTGEDIEETIRNAEDARKEWIFAALEENIKIPEPSAH